MDHQLEGGATLLERHASRAIAPTEWSCNQSITQNQNMSDIHGEHPAKTASAADSAVADPST